MEGLYAICPLHVTQTIDRVRRRAFCVSGVSATKSPPKEVSTMTPTPDCVLDALIDEAIPQPYRWERNWKGHLVRHYNGWILTVFETRPGWFMWSRRIRHQRKKPRYSD